MPDSAGMPEMKKADDVSDACRSVDLTLESWNKFVVPNKWGYSCSPDISEDTPGAIRLIHLEAEEKAVAGLGSLVDDRRYRDERPYFHDPAPLGFDPTIACQEDTGEGEEGVALRDVWRDPLARTFWLAIKARHLTSQYFRGHCLALADGTRSKPKAAADDLWIPADGFGMSMNTALYFRVQIYPYIVKVLMDEGLWPYLHPGVDNVASGPLGWVVRESPDA